MTLSWTVCRLGLATINLHTKYEVSTFTQYKDMKLERRQKNEKIDMVWGLWAPKGHHPHNHSTERIRLPIQL